MRVFAPSAFRYPPNTGADFPYGWQELPDALADTLRSGGYVMSDLEDLKGGRGFTQPEMLALTRAGLVGSTEDSSNKQRLLDGGQPAGITKALRSQGKLVASFSTSSWSVTAGSPTVSNHTGYDSNGVVTGPLSRTGQASMLKMVVTTDSTTQIVPSPFATTVVTPALAGRLGLWVYVENLPGYGTGGGSGGITLELWNALGGGGEAVSVAWNANQVREGWNWLTFVQRNPAAYVDGSGVTERHPYGVIVSNYGSGLGSDLVNQPLSGMSIYMQGMNGATVYFDSLWTGFSSQPQIVLGVDSAGSDFSNYVLPEFRKYGWVGYLASPIRVWASGSKVISDFTGVLTRSRDAYADGWDVINHTGNHIANGALTDAAEIAYEVTSAHSLNVANGLRRGCEFYASPQSSTSRLSEKVIKGRGFVLQRHARKANIGVTAWGVDNPHHLGASDISSAASPAYSQISGGASSSVNGLQKASVLRNLLEVMVAYGDTWFPFLHVVTTLGDSGSGEDAGPDNLTMTLSAFKQFMADVRASELAGQVTVCRGITGFYYGV